MKGGIENSDQSAIAIGQVVTDLMFGLLVGRELSVETPDGHADEGASEAAQREDGERVHGQAAAWRVAASSSEDQSTEMRAAFAASLR